MNVWDQALARRLESMRKLAGRTQAAQVTKITQLISGSLSGVSLLAHLDTLLRSRPAWRERYTSFWSSGARRTLAIAALNIALVWCVVGAVIWQGYRDAVADGKRMAANFGLATAAYTQQALVATDLMLRSMQDWVADEDIQSETTTG